MIESFGTEAARILASENIRREYDRRLLAIPPSLYACWNPGEMFLREGRRRTAAGLLKRAGAFPAADHHCLEIGYGRMGWLADLVGWGVPPSHVHGIELDEKRAAFAQQLFPTADLRVGDATQLPWPDDFFDLIIVSTVFTSILDDCVRSLLAQEITRSLAPGGAFLCYDFRCNNPRNPNVRKLTAKEIKRLFPRLNGKIVSTTLAPPLARVVAPACWWLAAMMETIPLLRTHLVAVLTKTD